MQHPIRKFRPSSTVFNKTRYFVWKTENFDKLQLTLSLIFFAETFHMSPTYQCLQKDVWDFFILFTSGVICKKLKRLGFYTLIALLD